MREEEGPIGREKVWRVKGVGGKGGCLGRESYNNYVDAVATPALPACHIPSQLSHPNTLPKHANSSLTAA